MFLRIRMRILLMRLNWIWYSHDLLDDIICAEELHALKLSRRDIDALEALADIDVVELDYGDFRIVGIAKGPHRLMYMLERSELWFNRIASFLAGIGSTLLVQLLIRVLFVTASTTSVP